MRGKVSRQQIANEAQALERLGYLFAKPISGGSSMIYKIPPGKFERIKEHISALAKMRQREVEVRI
mgnify:CR=1 FL=1